MASGIHAETGRVGGGAGGGDQAGLMGAGFEQIIGSFPTQSVFFAGIRQRENQDNRLEHISCC